ncbi:hypothetical protein FACS1894186_5500 [Alphaproteobacteria bacterium]|nr:hypothetical protein FACS1894186_5500 [Alphaproteobacteria bacterium]
MTAQTILRRCDNAKLNALEIKARKTVLYSYPSNIQISPTENCNLSCFHCYRHKWKDTLYAEDMDARLLDIESVRQAASCAQNAWLVSGGESFLYKDFAKIIRFLNKSEVDDIFMITNGTVYDEEIIDTLATGARAHIKVSMEGATTATVNDIKGAPVYEKILNFLRRHSLCDRLRPYLAISMVLMKQNYHELPQLMTLASELGIPKVEAHHCQPLNDEVLNMGLYDMPEEYNRLIRQARRESKRLGVELWTPPLFRRSSAAPIITPCRQPWTFFLINQIGDVYPCCHLWGHKFGNVFRDSFDGIWNGPLMRKLRSDIAEMGYSGYAWAPPAQN